MKTKQRLVLRGALSEAPTIEPEERIVLLGNQQTTIAIALAEAMRAQTAVSSTETTC